jgi:hypothetical protein
MSIVTLKKKSLVKYNNMSVGSKNGGFSINGTHRSAGYIGRGVLGLSFPRTPMRGNEARGNGGCCGKYNRGTIVSSGVCFPTGINGETANNDSSIVKSSVLDTNGQIMTQYRWIRRPYPYAVVKPDGNMIQNTQTSYIENLAKKTISDLNKCNSVKQYSVSIGYCSGLSNGDKPRPFNSVIRIPRGWYSITKTAENTSALGPISQSAFIKRLAGSCNTNPLPKSSICNTPIP